MSTNEVSLDGSPAPRGGDLALNVPKPRKRIPSQLPLLVMVLAVSGGALHAMRQYGMRSGLTFDAVTVDYKEQDSSAKAKTYERIMDDLARIQKPLDVTLTEFGRSPFMRETVTARVTPEVKPIEPGMSDAERHRAEAADAIKRLKVGSIIGTIARIDDITVKAGDPVGELFTVKSIDGRSVTLIAYDEEFTLTMEAPAPNAPKKGAARMGNSGR